MQIRGLQIRGQMRPPQQAIAAHSGAPVPMPVLVPPVRDWEQERTQAPEQARAPPPALTSCQPATPGRAQRVRQVQRVQWMRQTPLAPPAPRAQPLAARLPFALRWPQARQLLAPLPEPSRPEAPALLRPRRTTGQPAQPRRPPQASRPPVLPSAHWQAHLPGAPLAEALRHRRSQPAHDPPRQAQAAPAHREDCVPPRHHRRQRHPASRWHHWQSPARVPAHSFFA